MPSSKFPGPKYNQIIEPNSDSQIVTVPLEEMGFGARKKSQEKDIKNSMTIRHVGNEGGRK